MAGKEQRGSQAAEAALFRGRPYVLTPDRPETPLSVEFRSWLHRIGANIIETSAAEHDRLVAFTSHLPQLLSTALAGTLARQNEQGFLRVFGPGLVDMTRLALSTPDLWSSILATNKREITLSINLFQDYLQEIKEAIETDDLPRFFDTASEFASSIRKLTSTSQA
jgi:prephenate dehydrogenase